MGKNTKLTLLLLAALPAAYALAGPKRYYEVVADTRPAQQPIPVPPSQDPPPLPKEKVKEPVSPLKEKGLLGAVEEADVPERRKMKKSTISVHDGADVKGYKRTVTVPKKSEWRIIWRAELVDRAKKGDITIRVDFPGKDGFQEIGKTLGPSEDGTYGALNVCERGGGVFEFAVNADNVKWHAEVQLVD